MISNSEMRKYSGINFKPKQTFTGQTCDLEMSGPFCSPYVGPQEGQYCILLR